MSWPLDGGPRFVVGELTGFTIGLRGPRTSNASSLVKTLTSYGVHDRAYSHRVVREFIDRQAGRGYLQRLALDGKSDAEAFAADLNAEADRAAA